MNDLILLCECCGYPIRALPDEPAAAGQAPPPCPECGTPITDSLPARRAGSPWQRRPGIGGWFCTALAMIRRPAATFGEVLIQRRARGLLTVNVLLAAALIAPPFVGVLTFDPARSWRGGGPMLAVLGWGVGLAAAALIVFGCIQVLTLIEFVGIRFFARRRRWRLSRDAAAQVCAHASVGWLASGFLPYLLAPSMVVLVQALGLSDRQLDCSPYFSAKFPVSALASATGYTLGLAGGMIAFEWLVYLGVRRNRFANHAAAARTVPNLGPVFPAGSQNRPT